MVHGLASLNRKLKRTIPDAVRKAARVAMEKSAVELVATMKGFVPVDSGDLRESIGWTWGNAPAGSFSGTNFRSNAGGETLTIFAGNKQVYYARWVEFGTAPGRTGRKVVIGTRRRKQYRTHPGTNAQPFFFPAYRLNKRRIKGRTTRAINQAIKQAAAS